MGNYGRRGLVSVGEQALSFFLSFLWNGPLARSVGWVKRQRNPTKAKNLTVDRGTDN
ncbi:MAG: hypothetical protein F6K39_25260 [Okeania sp. SIO3B3]|nr:hypothetical protein [Okeania sp. SIO3B3]